jgi:hypothetical protein
VCDTAVNSLVSTICSWSSDLDPKIVSETLTPYFRYTMQMQVPAETVHGIAPKEAEAHASLPSVVSSLTLDCLNWCR